MDLEKAHEIYEKLKPCLAVVDAHWDQEYGWLPVFNGEQFNYHINNGNPLWRTNPEDEKYRYRIAKVEHPDPTFPDRAVIIENKILLWEPKLKAPRPTFEEFLTAYNIDNLQ